LASGCQLAWLPVLDESAEDDPPRSRMVVPGTWPAAGAKSDNGSGFIAEAMRRFLDRWEPSLFSPPYLPRVQWSCRSGQRRVQGPARMRKRARQDRAATGRWMTARWDVAWQTNSVTPTTAWTLRGNPAPHLASHCDEARGPQPHHTGLTGARASQARSPWTRPGQHSRRERPCGQSAAALVEHGFLTFTPSQLTPLN